jgi:hypothetical protein
MSIVGGLDIHRKQLTFDYLDTATRQVRRGQITPADREHLRAWLARFSDDDDIAFAMEGCLGWRYVAEELAAAPRPPLGMVRCCRLAADRAGARRSTLSPPTARANARCAARRTPGSVATRGQLARIGTSERLPAGAGASIARSA